MDAVLTRPSALSHVKNYIATWAALEQELRQKGITEVFCIAGSLQAFRFAEMFGFKSNNEVIAPKYEVMRKALTMSEHF